MICEKTIIPDSCREIFLPLTAKNSSVLMEAGILLAGISELFTGYEIYRPAAEHYAVLITIEGKGLVYTSKAKTILEKNSLYICKSGELHHYLVYKKYWKMIWFHLEKCEKWHHLLAVTDQMQKCRMGVIMEQVMRQLIIENLSESMVSDRIISLYANLILAYLEREISANIDPETRCRHHELNRLWEKVNSNPAKNWTVKELAREMNLSHTHFARICNKFNGVSPLRMVTRLRMEKAKELLKNSYLPIYQIAEIVGYNNQYAFSVAFKRFAGCSPSRFAKKKKSPVLIGQVSNNHD